MGNIIQFPTKNKHNVDHPNTKDEKLLRAKQKLMRFHYDRIKTYTNKLMASQAAAASIEADYNTLIKALIEKVGFDNINPEHFDYCKNAKPVVIDGEIKLEL